MIRKKVNKCDLSPNGEKFSRLMRDAFENETEYDETRARPIDYSFMDEIPEEPEQSKKRYHFGSATRVAAVILVFSTAVLSTSIWLNSEPANAGKFKLEKMFYQMRNGLFTSDGGESQKDYTEEDVNIFKIETMDDIDKAKKFMPQLLTFDILPEKSKFKALEIVKTLKNNYTATYYFEKDSKQFIVNIQDAPNDSTLVDSLLNGEIIEMQDRQICIWDEETTDAHGVNMAMEGMIIFITGEITKDEMRLIAENMV